MKAFIKSIIPIVDLLLSPIVLGSALVLKALRRVGLQNAPLSRGILDHVGLLPVHRHYYEPFVSESMLRRPLDEARPLPGIELNVQGQLELLSRFHYQDELKLFSLEPVANPLEFYYRNGAYCSGDAEMLYSMIRHFKPARVLEIGAGMSTLLIRKALQVNQQENPGLVCDHVCVEPYERDWLERTGARVVRQPVEVVDMAEFEALSAGDILFIDSTHIIRPQGDVLFEYLEVLPRLRPGVLVHVHDVFTPRDYPASWVLEHKRLWNEQYLLEAFLSCNPEYQIIAAVNYLSHEHRAVFSDKCPVFAQESGVREPGAFWFMKVDETAD